MNYGILPEEILSKVMTLVGLINNIEVSPDVRRRYMEQLFRTVNAAVYNKIYEMNAWDMLIPHTTGKDIGKQHLGISKIAAGSPVTGIELTPLVLENLQAMSGKAQDDAMATAQSSGKVPQMKRSATSRKPCDWCKEKDTRGRWVVDPDSEQFRRHAHCSCEIYTAGYKSRNGLLDNYVKEKKA